MLALKFERCRREPSRSTGARSKFLEVRDRGFAPRRPRRKAAGKPESLHVELLLRLGLPEGTKRRVAERLGDRTHRPAYRAALAGSRGGAAHGARFGRSAPAAAR